MTIPYSTKPFPAMGEIRDTNLTNVSVNDNIVYLEGLWVNQKNNGVQVYTTTQRDALTPNTGQVIYNITDSVLQVYNGGWTNL
jgi:hypothetical protein